MYVINDLLDLTKAEEGQSLINDEMFDLLATVREATDSFKSEANRKGLQYDLIEHSRIPQSVYGNQRYIRQAVSNIIANAIGNTSSGWVRVEVWLAGVIGDKFTIEVTVEDSGAGMSEKKVDALFRDLEQATSEESAESGKSSEQLTGGKGDRVLGLGLAVVARIVWNMNGQVRLKLDEGQGSRFIIQLPFSCPEKDEQVTDVGDVVSRTISLPPVSTDEITLVEKGNPEGDKDEVREQINERRASLHGDRNESSRSNESNKSNVNRRVERISGPFDTQEEAVPFLK